MFLYFIILFHLSYSIEIYPSNEGFIVLDNNQNIQINKHNTDLKIENNEEFNKFDGSGETTELTTELSTTYTQPTDIILSSDSIFRISVNCPSASILITNILDQFNQTFTYPYNVTHNGTSIQCSRSLKNHEVYLKFSTDNHISILNNLVQTLAKIVSSIEGIQLYTVNQCGGGINDAGPIKNIDSCYLINLCSLCGTNPIRGQCLSEKNLSRCECFINTENLMISYIDEFCRISKDNSINSISSSWHVIIIGVLSGFTGLLIIIIFVFLLKSYRSYTRKNELELTNGRTLPRIQFSPSLTRSNSSTDSLFFENPDPLNSSRYSYDPINELDAIIDDEDIYEMTFE